MTSVSSTIWAQLQCKLSVSHFFTVWRVTVWNLLIYLINYYVARKTGQNCSVYFHNILNTVSSLGICSHKSLLDVPPFAKFLLTLTMCFKTLRQHWFDRPNFIYFLLFPRHGQLQPSSTQPTLCCSERTLSLLTQTQHTASGFSSTHILSKWFTNTSFSIRLSKNTQMAQADFLLPG